MTKTAENLKAAFAGECQAHHRYLAFAQRAADEYHEGVYKLLRAMAETETIHALKHLRHLKGVGTTRENLAAAVSEEVRGVKERYPKMIAEARDEGEKGAEITLTHAMEAEKAKQALLRQALEDPDGFPVQDYYLCQACGFIAAEAAPGRCPVCGSVDDAFYRAFSETDRGIPNL